MIVALTARIRLSVRCDLETELKTTMFRYGPGSDLTTNALIFPAHARDLKDPESPDKCTVYY